MTIETIVDIARSKGIEISVVDGALECVSDNPLPESLVAQIRRYRDDIMALLNRPKTSDPKKLSCHSDRIKPSDIATPPAKSTWLDEHADELAAAGYTADDLHNTGWPKGIAHLSLWNKPGLAVELKGNVLCFTWEGATGKPITQTARPEQTR